MVNSPEFSSLRSTAIQVGVALVANCGILNSGMVLTFPSSLIPPLLGSGPGLHVSVEEASWIAGVTFLSSPVACLAAGPVVDWLGRRRGLLLLNLTFAAGWLLLAVFPLSLIALYAGRVLTGLGLGLASCVAVTYTAEVVTTKLRTNMVTLTPVMMAIGNFIPYVWALLYQDSWTMASYFALGLTGLSALLSPLLPESPVWLLHQGQAEAALQALMRLRGTESPERVAQELKTLTGRANKDTKASWSNTFKLLCAPEAYKPLLLMNTFFIFHHMSGLSAALTYTVDFTKAAGIEAGAYYVALAVGLIRMFSATINSWACSRYGRRIPAVISGIVMSASVLALAAAPLISPPPWLAGAAELLFILSGSVGFSTLPWSMMGEIFPTNVRGVASGITACCTYLGAFTSAKFYPSMVRSLGNLVFVFFGVSGLFGTLFLYICLPETHGLTLIEIEESFKGSKKPESKKIPNP